MVLELHIWGPAFSLPSIDPNCLAAIGYLKRAVPEPDWVLIPSSDPSLVPSGELPALKDGSLWVAGFSNIVHHLREVSNGEWDLNIHLEAQQRADYLAFSSFILYNGQRILDLYLYVSSLNFTTSTRSAYAKILPWPKSWIWPSRIRSAAKKRSEHLGLSSLDIDSTDATDSGLEGASQIPKSLLKKPKETVTGLLNHSEHQSQFKLDALLSGFLGPLEDFLRGKPFFSSEGQLTTLDCLAIGYLSLALYSEVPHPWLRESLKSKYPDLASYTERVTRACFGPPLDVQTYLLPISDDPLRTPYESRSLPWKQPERPLLSDIGRQLLSNVADSIPFVSYMMAHSRLRRAANDEDLTHLERSDLKFYSAARRNEAISQMVILATGLSAFFSYALYSGVFKFDTPDEEEEEEGEASDLSSSSPFGEAGEILGLGRNHISAPSESEGSASKDEPVPGVEVDSEQDLSR